jgi:hypothetical protein
VPGRLLKSHRICHSEELQAAKNLEILRPAQAGLRMTVWWFLRGVYPEPVEGLRMTLVAGISAAC